MKKRLKITIIAVIGFNFSVFAQSGIKNYLKNLSVSSTNYSELTDATGNSLNINNIFKVQLVTTGTGTKTGAEYLVWHNNSLWNLRAVNIQGNTSNHPIIFIENNIVKVKTNHPNGYNIKVFVEEIESSIVNVMPSIFGSSHQWQRFNNNLYYADGKVGIGTTNPSSKLQVNTYTGSGNAVSYGSITSFANSGDIGLYLGVANENIGARGWGFSTRSVGVNSSLDIIEKGLNGTRMTITSGGNIGIGTTTPDSKLSVNGKIHTKEVKVDLIGWSDFVFEKNYDLPTLKEVEKHINEKGHLKDIPSAKEVEKNGIFLGEMNAKLLQKIEELTLYTIAQEKQLKFQISKIEKVKKENESLTTNFLELRKRLEKLEKK